MILGGRTGRQTPRTGKMFLNWATEEVVLGVLKNWQKFSAWAMDYKPEYLHGGHLIDRAGYKKFKQLILEGGAEPECLVAEVFFWHETEYRSNFNVKPISQHHSAEPAGSNGLQRPACRARRRKAAAGLLESKDRRKQREKYSGHSGPVPAVCGLRRAAPDSQRAPAAGAGVAPPSPYRTVPAGRWSCRPAPAGGGAVVPMGDLAAGPGACWQA